MTKVFMFRHQAGGVLSEFVFGEVPTPDQAAAVRKLCDARFGTTHRKTGEAYWLRLVRMPVLSPIDPIMAAEAPASPTSNVTVLHPPTVKGTGTVTPKD